MKNVLVVGAFLLIGAVSQAQMAVLSSEELDQEGVKICKSLDTIIVSANRVELSGIAQNDNDVITIAAELKNSAIKNFRTLSCGGLLKDVAAMEAEKAAEEAEAIAEHKKTCSSLKAQMANSQQAFAKTPKKNSKQRNQLSGEYANISKKAKAAGCKD